MADSAEPQLHVGPATVVETAAVKVDGTARIDGTFHGDLEATHLVVGASGRIVGTVRGVTADVEGQLEGTLALSGQLTVRSTGVLRGNVGYGGLSVEAGARLVGDVSSGTSDGPVRTPKPSATRAPAVAAATGRSRRTTDDI